MLNSKNMVNVYTCLAALGMAFVFNMSNRCCFSQNIVKAMEFSVDDVVIKEPSIRELNRLNRARDVNDFLSIIIKIKWPGEYLSNLSKDELISPDDAKKIIDDFHKNVNREKLNNDFSSKVASFNNEIKNLELEVESLKAKIRLLEGSKSAVSDDKNNIVGKELNDTAEKLKNLKKILSEKEKSLGSYRAKLQLTESICEKFLRVCDAINCVFNSYDDVIAKYRISTGIDEFFIKYDKCQWLLMLGSDENFDDSETKQIYQIYCDVNKTIKRLVEYSAYFQRCIDYIKEHDTSHGDILGKISVTCDSAKKLLNSWRKTLVMLKIAIGGKFFKILDNYISELIKNTPDEVAQKEINGLLGDLKDSNSKFSKLFSSLE